MQSDKVTEMQHQMRTNTSELGNFLTDLADWEESMKVKDKELSRKSPSNGVDETTRKKLKLCNDSLENLQIDDKKQQALKDKEMGNQHLQEGNFQDAVSCYTSGMANDPENAILPANRALAYMKLNKFALAEADCTASISLDQSYTKAYLRRGAARVKLDKLNEAETDFQKVLHLEPKNKQAMSELEQIKKKKEPPQRQNVTKPNPVDCRFSIPPHLHFPPRDGTMVLLPDFTPPHALAEKPLIPIEVKNVNSALQAKVERISRNDSSNKIKSMSTPMSATGLTPTLPAVPLKSTQFVADWKKLEHYPEVRYQYLKQFPAKQLPLLFGDFMESEVFESMLQILAKYFIENDDDVYSYLMALSEVGRFKTLISFMSDLDTLCVKALLSYVHNSSRYSAAEKYALKEKYNLVV